MLENHHRSTLANRQIVLGVTGGIAAYKAAELVRLLVQHDAQVRVVMTPAAQEFITPLTMQALSGQAVHCELLDPSAESAMGHIQLARWADVIVVAPASADFIANLSQGTASELLSAVCLSSTAPLLLAPAMNQAMWGARSTQGNIAHLKKRGVRILGPDDGEQACGDVGMGRMSEPAQLREALSAVFVTRELEGVDVVITAGGTREPIDAVRYIGNRSSGRMAYALARAAVDAGARVTLISCAQLAVPERVRHIAVETAADMHKATREHLEQCQVYIGAAAVADFRPSEIRAGKLDRKDGETRIILQPNPDIIAEVATATPRPFVVGFAAEVEHLLKRGRDKLTRKGLDMICVNPVGVEGTGFDSEENELHVLWAGGERHLKRATKSRISVHLVELIAKRYRLYQKTSASHS